MNNTSNSDSSQSADANPPGASPNPQSSSQSGRCAFEPLCSAAGEGARRARAAAERAIPRIRAAAWCATYWLGYGASFATVFSYRVAKELAPEALKAGCRDGTKTAGNVADDLVAKLRARSASWRQAPAEGSA
jgi:hypothetical protein